MKSWDLREICVGVPRPRPTVEPASQLATRSKRRDYRRRDLQFTMTVMASGARDVSLTRNCFPSGVAE
jgi:hypothetical protein